jgi:hypothetical protein
MEKTALITLVVPIVIEVLKVLAPRFPKRWLPILAPIVGALADILAHFSGLLSESNPAMAALYGMAGAGLYDIYHHVYRKPSSPVKTQE